MCNKQLTKNDVMYVYDHFSAKLEPVCRHCGFRLIILIGFRIPFMHGFRRVDG